MREIHAALRWSRRMIALLSLCLVGGSVVASACPAYMPPYAPPNAPAALIGCWATGGDQEPSGGNDRDELSASFSWGPAEGEAPLRVDFLDESSGDVVAWWWDFGNGRTSTDACPTTEYWSFGSYGITLTIHDETGHESTATGTVDVFGREPTWRSIGNPDTLVYADTAWDLDLDPACAVDSGSRTVIFNVYESLFQWPAGLVDANERDLGYSLDPRDLLPMLGTVVPTLENGLIVELDDGRVQYIVPIREGISFHSGNLLTAEDVEYSFERAILCGGDADAGATLIEAFSGGRYWSLSALVEEFLGIDASQWQEMPSLQDWEQEAVHDLIDAWVEIEDDNVIFTLDEPYAPFLSMLAHGNTVASIVDKAWCRDMGGWDGEPDTWAASTAAGMPTALAAFAGGTGPYRLGSFEPRQAVDLVRYDGYWREPASLERARILLIPEVSPRLAALECGEADIARIVLDDLPQADAMPGLVVHRHLPTLTMSPVAFFNTEIAVSGNTLVGSGTLSDDGIPSDFFADVHVRRAFAHAFDPVAYIDEALWMCGALDTCGPIPRAIDWAYGEDPCLSCAYDPEEAEEEMRQAFDGELWQTGFTLTLPYWEGHDEREVLCRIWECEIESINPRFHVNPLAMPMGNYDQAMLTQRLPLLLSGWTASADPHGSVHAVAHPLGWYPQFQGDAMLQVAAEYGQYVDEARSLMDVESRILRYVDIRRWILEDCFHVWLPQVSGYRVMQDWVQGWGFNPVWPGPYFYGMRKAYD